MKSLVNNIKNWTLDIILPQKCLQCHFSGKIICDSCVLNIRHAERETQKHIFAVYDYRDPIIKKAIWNLKYHKQRHLGEKLGKLLYEGFMEDFSELKQYINDKPIYVIPVPIDKTRNKKRGYNQAEVIASHFCSCDKNQILKLKTNIVQKKIKTLPQAKITNRNKRLKNVQGVFEIKNKELVLDKTIIIIDDVTTTGATINEIIKILKQSGARHVFGFAVAH